MIERLAGAPAVARSAAIAEILSQAFESPSQRWSPESVAATLAAPGGMALVAPGGCALLRIAADEAELLTIAVEPAARRQGLGARLLAACLAEATARGAARMHLEVAAGNAPAIALYEAAGWMPSGRRPGYYGSEDALLMSRVTGADGDGRHSISG